MGAAFIILTIFIFIFLLMLLPKILYIATLIYHVFFPKKKIIGRIMEVLNRELPETYTKSEYDEKCEEVYQHVYDSYYGVGKSLYESVG